jgi:cysteine desulfurase
VLRSIVVRIYLDHNATTPVDLAVVQAVNQAMREEYGNPSSVHYFGQRAKNLLDRARQSVATLLGGDPAEVVFTSGGTEADNLALRGVAEALAPTGRRHLISSPIEHEAILQTLKALGRRGWEITLLPIDESGIVSPRALADAIRPDTALVSIMHANNEIGTIQPLHELATIAHAHGALMHSDAVQTAGKILLDVKALGIDLASISGHKLYAPKGVGALWVRRGLRLLATMTGGRQERNRRAGTENVPGIAGLGAAVTLALEKLHTESTRLAALRDRLDAGILASVPGTAINGARDRRVPNTTNISFDGIEAESLLIALDLEGVAVSTGSACSSGTLEPSHVLKAMGFPLHRTQNAIRFSLGAANTADQIDHVIALLPPIVERLRKVTAGQTAHPERPHPAVTGAEAS